MLTPEQLATLIEKYEAGSATPEELERLDRWYHSYDDSTGYITEPGSEDELYKTMRSRLHRSLHDPVTGSSPSRFNRKYLAWAAAITGVLLVATIYFFMPGKKEKGAEISANNMKTETAPIVPGSDKAILTLASGKQIILDNASDGLLATEAGIRIEKLKDGSLLYQASGENSAGAGNPVINIITTPRGGQYQVTLSDGTKVWLNAASSIRFPVSFSQNERRVAVTGESFFDVAKNKKRPFRIELPSFDAGNGTNELEVLGTQFNINAYDDESRIRTTLVEGQVKISAKQGSTFLKPGQESAIEKNGKIKVTTLPGTDEAVAWKNGHFQFKSTDLRTILRQIARWYDVEVEYRGDVDLHFTGQLTRNEDVNKVFEKLELTGEVRFSVEGRKIIVTQQ